MLSRNKRGQTNSIKIFSLIILGLFMLSFLANFVSASPDFKEVGETVIKYAVGDWKDIGINNVETTNLIIKFFIMLIIFLVIASITKEIDFLSSPSWMSWVISGIMIIIGSKFISSSFLIGLFLPTGALLLTLSVTLQFFMIFEINRKIFKNNYFFSWLSWTLWGFFLMGLILYFSGNNFFGFDISWIRSLLGWSNPQITINTSLQLTYLAIAVLSLMGVTNKIQRWVNIKLIRAGFVDINRENYDDMIAQLTARIGERERREANLSGGALATSKRKTAELKELLKEKLKQKTD